MHLTGGPFDYVIVFLGGVLMSFTPCSYPLLPIAVAYLAGANTKGSHTTGFLLSMIYVLGMAFTYSILALVAALSGKVFGTFQNHFWVQFVIANLVLLFSLMMLDVIPIPSFSVFVLPQKLRKGWLGVFVVGAVSGFVVGPCTAPALGTLLVFVATRQNILFGVSLLFTFAVGLGTVLLIAGTFSGFLSSLPKSGAWTQGIKKFAGLALLAMAEYYFIKAGQVM